MRRTQAVKAIKTPSDHNFHLIKTFEEVHHLEQILFTTQKTDIVVLIFTIFSAEKIIQDQTKTEVFTLTLIGMDHIETITKIETIQITVQFFS